MRKLWFVIILMCSNLCSNFYYCAFANEMPLVLSKNITINRKFYNINQIASFINTITKLDTRVIDNNVNTKSTDFSSSGNFKESVLLRQANDTIESLLNMINRKTAYTWSYNNNTIIFTANKAVKVVDSFIINSNESKSESNIVDKNDTIESTKLANNLKERLVPQQWVLDPSDKTIREALNKWSKLANWQLIWNVSADYPIVTRWVINADFENAVNEVLRASSVTNVPLMANMYDNNHVLEIYSNNNYEK